MNDQEIAAYNLKLASDTKELIGNVIVELFRDPAFMHTFKDTCVWSLCDAISPSLVANYKFQNELRNFLTQQINKS